VDGFEPPPALQGIDPHQQPQGPDNSGAVLRHGGIFKQTGGFGKASWPMLNASRASDVLLHRCCSMDDSGLVPGFCKFFLDASGTIVRVLMPVMHRQEL
jgi:hypothetical protein